ncbi:MAG: polysaccharide pyruvyl transferase family protein [Alphaproteobacteria bacterium]|nr:polysaccharide pyruvyl transferase family protein [Alphaproteobacteria bacterium]
MMEIPYDYCDIENFGDQLNVYIFKHFTGLDVVKDNHKFAEVIGIGSIMDGLLLHDKGTSVSSAPLNVFSSGFGFDTNGQLCRNLRVFALRGKLTQKKLKEFNNVEYFYKDIPLGDGGLLASYLIQEDVEKVYDLGIVPHFADKDEEIFQTIKNNFGNRAIILDPTENPMVFLKNLMKCRAVISTAMHPLIACDSLRIPNMWVRISEITTSRFKFQDYYSAFDMEKQPFDLSNGFSVDDLDLVYRNYDITDAQVRAIQEKLIVALADIKEVLVNDIENIKIRHKKHMRTMRLVKFVCNFIPFKRVRKILRNKY